MEDKVNNYGYYLLFEVGVDKVVTYFCRLENHFQIAQVIIRCHLILTPFAKTTLSPILAPKRHL